MSSPHYIGMKKNSAISYVYCHNGAGLEYNGKTLYENYKTTEQVEALLEHGGMSYLKEVPEEKQYYKFWKGKTHYATYDVDKHRRPREADGGTPCYLWNGVEWLYSPRDGEVWFPLAAAFERQISWC